MFTSNSENLVSVWREMCVTRSRTFGPGGRKHRKGDDTQDVVTEKPHEVTDVTARHSQGHKDKQALIDTLVTCDDGSRGEAGVAT